jgi:hypothetical protein
MKKIHILSLLFIAFAVGALCALEKKIYTIEDYKIDRVYNLPQNLLFDIPGPGLFVPLPLAPKLFTGFTIDFKQLLADEISRWKIEVDALNEQIDNNKFWSTFWFIASCVAGALVLGGAVYIGIDLGIIHN